MSPLPLLPHLPLPELLLTDYAALEQLTNSGRERLKQLVSALPKPPILLAYPVQAEYERFFPAEIEPLLLNKPLRQAAAPMTESAELLAHSSLRILAADDNRGNQMLIRTFLKKFDLAADFADNGSDALQKMHETPYDVVLMDVNMPIMDGLEATRRIRAEIAPERQPWIIAITANVAAEDRQRCIDVGMNDFLEKPFAKAAFQKVLAAVKASGNAAATSEAV